MERWAEAMGVGDCWSTGRRSQAGVGELLLRRLQLLCGLGLLLPARGDGGRAGDAGLVRDRGLVLRRW